MKRSINDLVVRVARIGGDARPFLNEKLTKWASLMQTALKDALDKDQIDTIEDKLNSHEIRRLVDATLDNWEDAITEGKPSFRRCMGPLLTQAAEDAVSTLTFFEKAELIGTALKLQNAFDTAHKVHDRIVAEVDGA